MRLTPYLSRTCTPWPCAWSGTARSTGTAQAVGGGQRPRQTHFLRCAVLQSWRRRARRTASTVCSAWRAMRPGLPRRRALRHVRDISTAAALSVKDCLQEAHGYGQGLVSCTQTRYMALFKNRWHSWKPSFSNCLIMTGSHWVASLRVHSSGWPQIVPACADVIPARKTSVQVEYVAAPHRIDGVPVGAVVEVEHVVWRKIMRREDEYVAGEIANRE